jgi:hypothetical protein
MKTLTLDMTIETNWLDLQSHEIYNKENGINFSAYPLTDCPEDATVERDLFNGYDYVKALNKGIELAKKGYDKVEIKEVKI